MLAGAMLLVAPNARAEAPAEAARIYFNQGVKLYNLGHFQDAIHAFEAAYDLDPAPILIFNIAQSHRQLGNKERAIFFYRRYLEQDPNPANRTDIEQRIKDLSESLEQEKELQRRPPTEVAWSASASGAGTPKAGAPTSPTVAVAPVRSERGQSTRWTVAADVGPSFLSFSGGPVSAPTVFTARFRGMYALPVLRNRLCVGVEAMISSLPYDALDFSQHTSSLWGLLVHAEYRLPITPDFSVAGGLGGGALWWSGLDAGNPFTNDGVAASGAIPLPTLQIAARAEYRMVKRLFVELAPEFLLSQTTSGGLTDVISAVERFDLSIGAGYSF